MLDGDQGWRVRAVHIAGVLLLAAFAAAFAISAFTAKARLSAPAEEPTVERSGLPMEQPGRSPRGQGQTSAEVH